MPDHIKHFWDQRQHLYVRRSAYWPGITNEIQCTRDACTHCNRITPTQPHLPPFETHITTTPFEAINSNYFFYKNWYYLVVADRLSGWTKQTWVRQNITSSGSTFYAKPLVSYLQHLVSL